MCRSYNCLTERWIPVEWCNSDADQHPKVGIREALKRAGEIKCIAHTAPFIEFGLYRLLITIVLDAYIVAGRRPTIGKMKAMLNRENRDFDSEVLDNYLNRYESCFDLWNRDNPFLQHAVVNNTNPQPISKLLAAIPSGVNVIHWHHFNENDTRITEELAAQLLTTISPWNFKVKPGEVRTLTVDPPMYALVLGNNLFETIVLNLPRPNGRLTFRKELNNGPAWRTQLNLNELPKVPTITQGFTWPVRIIMLEDNGELIARSVNYAAYKKPTDRTRKENEKRIAEEKTPYILFDVKNGWRDPNAGVETDQNTIKHITASQNVPIWQDAVPLFLVASEGESLSGEKRRSRPEVISNALRVLETPTFRVAVYGMRKKAEGSDTKVEEWFRSVLTLPTEVARDSRLASRAIDAFRRTQKVADALQIASRMLRPPVKGNYSKKMPQTRQDLNALFTFWRSLEPVLVEKYLNELNIEQFQAEGELYRTIRHQARETLRSIAEPHCRTADGLFRVANATNWFERKLAKLLPIS